MKKLPTHVFGAPQCGPFQTNEGVCQSDQNGPILNFSTIFCAKSKFKEGKFYGKLPSSVFRASWGGPFCFKPCLPTYQIQADQFFFILNLKYKICWGLFYTKNCCRPKLVWLAHSHQPNFVCLFQALVQIFRPILFQMVEIALQINFQ